MQSYLDQPNFRCILGLQGAERGRSSTHDNHVSVGACEDTESDTNEVDGIIPRLMLEVSLGGVECLDLVWGWVSSSYSTDW